MSVRLLVYAPVFVFGLALLILIIGLSEIVAISSRNRRPRFSYFAGGMRSCSHAAAAGEQA
jgi:hypothetical protein